MSALSMPSQSSTQQQQQTDMRVSASLGSGSWRSALPPASGLIQDISDDAVWSLSSCKEGLGVHQLLDDRSDTYWQSDGLQPHTITIEFQRKTDISFIVIYLDYKADESYTPSKIQVQTGYSIIDLDDPKTQTFTEPNGWKPIDLREHEAKRPIRAFVVQIQILQNHQNGRDTHIRGLRVLGPGSSTKDSSKRALAQSNDQMAEHFEDENFTKSIEQLLR